MGIQLFLKGLFTSSEKKEQDRIKQQEALRLEIKNSMENKQKKVEVAFNLHSAHNKLEELFFEQAKLEVLHNHNQRFFSNPQPIDTPKYNEVKAEINGIIQDLDSLPKGHLKQFVSSLEQSYENDLNVLRSDIRQPDITPSYADFMAQKVNIKSDLINKSYSKLNGKQEQLSSSSVEEPSLTK